MLSESIEINQTENQKDRISRLSGEKTTDSLLQLYQMCLSSGPETRYSARKALRQLKEYFFEKFLELPEDNQQQFLKMAGDFLDTESVDFLCQILPCLQPKMMIYAVQSLGLIGDHRALPHLREILFRSGTDNFVKSALVKALARLGSSEEISEIQGMLKSSDQRLKANTIEALELTGDHKAIPLIRPFLAEKDHRVKAYAARALWKFGDRTMLSHFQKLLEETPPDKRESIIYAVGETKSLQVLPLLIRECENDNPVIIRTASEKIADIIRENPQPELLFKLGKSFEIKNARSQKQMKNQAFLLGEYYLSQPASSETLSMLSAAGNGLTPDLRAERFLQRVWEKDPCVNSFQDLFCFYRETSGGLKIFRFLYQAAGTAGLSDSIRSSLHSMSGNFPLILKFRDELTLISGDFFTDQDFSDFWNSFADSALSHLVFLTASVEIFNITSQKIRPGKISEMLNSLDQQLVGIYLPDLENLLIKNRKSGIFQTFDLSACHFVTELFEQLIISSPETDRMILQTAEFAVSELSSENKDISREIMEFLSEKLEKTFPEKARQLYEDLLENDTENVRLHLRLARLLEQNGEIRDACEEYIIVSEISKKNNDRFLMTEALKKATALDPENRNAATAMSQVFLEYMESYSKILDNSPDNADVLTLLCEEKLSMSDTKTAFSCMEKKLTLTSDPQVIFKICDDFLNLLKEQNSQEYFCIKTIMMSVSWKTSEFIPFIRNLYGKPWIDSVYQTALKTRDFKMKKTMAAAVSLLLKDNDRHIDALQNLLKEASSDIDDSLQLLQSVFQEIPDPALRNTILTESSAFYETCGKPEKSLEIIRSLLENDPENQNLLKKCAILCEKLELNDDALKIWEKLSVQGKNSEAFLRTAILNEQLDSPEEAFAGFKKILETRWEENAFQGAQRILQSFLRQGQIELAFAGAFELRDLILPQQAADELSDFYRLLEKQMKIVSRIDNILRLGEPEKALENICMLVESDTDLLHAGIYGLLKLKNMWKKDNSDITLKIAEYRVRLKDYLEAVKTLAELENSSRNDEGRIIAAYCLIRISDFDSAYRMLNRISPDTIRSSEQALELYSVLRDHYEKNDDRLRTTFIDEITGKN